MARPFSELPGSVHRLARSVERSGTPLVRAVGGALHQSLVRGTPVDTGRARSNWVVTRNAPFPGGPDHGGIPPYAPGRKLGIAETANAEAALAQGRAATLAFDSRRDRALYITNNVFYIGALEGGHSLQAPTGFVRQAIATVRPAIVQALRRISDDARRAVR